MDPNVQPHPVSLSIADDLQRNRLTVFFRLLLAIPHLVVLCIWAILVYVVTVLNWFAALITGRVPLALHNFVAGFIVYSTRVSAYYHLVTNDYPPFGDGPYQLTVHVGPPVQQNRWKTFFRTLLAIPASIIVGILGYVQNIVTIFSWIIALILGRIPLGLRNWGLVVMQMQAQLIGYTLLVTDVYPQIDPFNQQIAGATDLASPATAMPITPPQP